MNSFFFLIIFLTTNANIAALTDLSGVYDFQDCSCTVLRCLEPSPYQINQNQNGDFTITYSVNIAARGKITTVNNGQQTQLSMQWLPGMDFDTNCTGRWIPTKRSIDLECGDQYRYCTGQFKCRENSGPCAKNSSTALSIQYCSAFWKMIFITIFLRVIKTINHSFFY
jgi:hypothetical protein